MCWENVGLGTGRKKPDSAKTLLLLNFVFLRAWGDGRKFHSRTDQALIRPPKTLRIKPSRKNWNQALKQNISIGALVAPFVGFSCTEKIGKEFLKYQVRGTTVLWGDGGAFVCLLGTHSPGSVEPVWTRSLYTSILQSPGMQLSWNSCARESVKKSDSEFNKKVPNPWVVCAPPHLQQPGSVMWMWVRLEQRFISLCTALSYHLLHFCPLFNNPCN